MEHFLNIPKREKEKKNFTKPKSSGKQPLIRGSNYWVLLKAEAMTCLLRNPYEGREATVRTGRGTTDWLQIGKGVCQGGILSPCLFN